MPNEVRRRGPARLHRVIKKEKYEPDPRQITHVQETLQLLSVMTNDHRFEDAYNDNHQKGGPCTMCEVLDRIENRGIEKGIEKGELKAKREMALSLAGMGMSAEAIAQAARVSVETVKQWLTQE